MDKYIVKEPRFGADYPKQGNQNVITFAPNPGNNNMVMETMYFGGYGAEFPRTQHVSGYGGMPSPINPPAQFASTMVPSHTPAMSSGIDSRYLAAYADSNAMYIAGQRPQMQYSCDQFMPTGVFGGNYQNRSFEGAERNKPKTFTPQQVCPSITTKVRDPRQNKNDNGQNRSEVPLHPAVSVPTPSFTPNVGLPKREYENPSKVRFDKLKAIQKCGPRVFSGPIDQVLKWHKVLQDIGILILYEIVAKCVSVRKGESCAKNLVIRDDSGPAMQVVYYEIDFLLPELKIPCTVRVIGRIMPGTCRLQAFNVRPATGDDVATLSRRAAVASHHVAKICKEFGIN